MPFTFSIFINLHHSLQSLVVWKQYSHSSSMTGKIMRSQFWNLINNINLQRILHATSIQYTPRYWLYGTSRVVQVINQIRFQNWCPTALCFCLWIMMKPSFTAAAAISYQTPQACILLIWDSNHPRLLCRPFQCTTANQMFQQSRLVLVTLS